MQLKMQQKLFASVASWPFHLPRVHWVLTGGAWTSWHGYVIRRGRKVSVGGNVLSPSSHLAVQTTFSSVHLCLSEGLRCERWCTKAQMWLCDLCEAFLHACGCWWKWWRFKAESCVVGGCRMMCLSEGRDTLMSVLPAISCCPCCDTPSLSSLRVILGTGAYYHFSSQRFPLKRLFLRVVKTNAIFKFFFCNQLLANDLSCLFFSGKALCSPSALRRLCRRGRAVSRIRCVQGFSWVLGAWSHWRWTQEKE